MLQKKTYRRLNARGTVWEGVGNGVDMRTWVFPCQSTILICSFHIPRWERKLRGSIPMKLEFWLYFWDYCFLQNQPLLALRGYCTPGPYFWRFCVFSQKIKQLRTKYPMDLVRNVPRNSNITVLLQQRPLLWSYSEKCAKINIFHVLSHKSITTWVVKFQCSN